MEIHNAKMFDNCEEETFCVFGCPVGLAITTTQAEKRSPKTSFIAIIANVFSGQLAPALLLI